MDNDRTGLFAELELGLAPTYRLRSGLRYDRAEAAGRATEDPPGMLMSPNALYTRY